MSEKERENLRTILRGWKLLNEHDVDGYVRRLADGFQWVTDVLPRPLVGREEAKQGLQAFFSAFKDKQFQVEQILASGDYVVTRFKAYGTHTGEFMGLAPTYRPFE